MTNDLVPLTNAAVQLATNTVNFVTHSQLSITPQAAAWEFKQWAGVIAMVASGLHTAIVLVSKFLDARYGGWLKWAFNGFFGSDVPPPASPGLEPTAVRQVDKGETKP
jgi:hypothetical protein